MTRTPFIAGNWKMNTSLEEAVTLIKTMQPGLNKIQGVEKVLCPPFVSLMAARGLTKGSSVKIGAQNVYFEEKGAFTGEVSPLMLKDLCE
jgi:triosephosphate isomerase